MMKPKRKPILTDQTRKAIGDAIIQACRTGVVRTAEFVMIPAPEFPRGYMLRERANGNKQPNN